MQYEGGYKYQLKKDEVIETGITGYMIASDYATLDSSGKLTIFKGYAWDGCSGPTYDCDKSMTPSLAHDTLYCLMQDGLLPSDCKTLADNLFYKLLIDRKFNLGRARAYFIAVVLFGKTERKKRDIKEVV